MTSQPALNALNFFMSDVRDGLGPFLGVYLQSENWSPSQIGLVMTIGALVGMAATAPLGALVDRIRAKRSMIVVAAVAVVLASMVILFAPGFLNTAVSQAISGIAGAAIAPAIAGITLGLVGQKGYAHQVGRNEAFNHAGNVTAAVLGGTFGYVFGIGAVFIVMAVMAVASMLAVWFIDPKRLDHRAARGLSQGKGDGASSWSTLATSKPLLVLAATLLLFHLGNAAMLPLLGQSLVAGGAGDPSAFTGATVVVAQFTMVPMAILAARLADTRGYWIVFVLALLALPVRGAIAALVTGPIGLVPVQVLDGVGAGLLGVAVPGLVARILSGTGHVNAGLGAVMTIQGIGAALSPALGGYIAERLGYATAFLVLSAVALVALGLWIVTRPTTAEYEGQAA
jgi:predicted MFS family arabinose efflux permease